MQILYRGVSDSCTGPLVPSPPQNPPHPVLWPPSPASPPPTMETSQVCVLWVYGRQTPSIVIAAFTSRPSTLKETGLCFWGDSRHTVLSMPPLPASPPPSDETGLCFRGYSKHPVLLFHLHLAGIYVCWGVCFAFVYLSILGMPFLREIIDRHVWFDHWWHMYLQEMTVPSGRELSVLWRSLMITTDRCWRDTSGASVKSLWVVFTSFCVWLCMSRFPASNVCCLGGL